MKPQKTFQILIHVKVRCFQTRNRFTADQIIPLACSLLLTEAVSGCAEWKSLAIASG